MGLERGGREGGAGAREPWSGTRARGDAECSALGKDAQRLLQKNLLIHDD
jgi:hypothetical protein